MSAAIERAGPADREALLALFAAQLAEHEIPLSSERLASAVDGALADRSRAQIFLARVEGAVVGVAYLSFLWALEHGGLSAWLEEMYVVPARRGEGVGRALLLAAVDHARARGAAAVDLEVEADHTRAANLYAREGFRPHRRTRWVRKLSP